MGTWWQRARSIAEIALRSRQAICTVVIIWLRRETVLWWAWLRVVFVVTGSVAALARFWQWVFW